MSSGDDEENGPDKAEAENNQPEESTLAVDVIESLALHAPDTLPEAPSKPESGASGSPCMTKLFEKSVQDRCVSDDLLYSSDVPKAFHRLLIARTVSYRSATNNCICHGTNSQSIQSLRIPSTQDPDLGGQK